MTVIVANCPTAKGRMEDRIRQMEGWLIWKLIKISDCETKKQTQKQPTQQNPAWNWLSRSVLNCGQVASRKSWAAVSNRELCSSASQQTDWKGMRRLWEVWQGSTQNLCIVFYPTFRLKNQISYNLVKCFSRQRLEESWQWGYSRSAGDAIGVWNLQCSHHSQLLMGFSRAARVFEA